MLLYGSKSDSLLYFWGGILIIAILVFILIFAVKVIKGISIFLIELVSSKEFKYLLAVAVIIFWIVMLSKNSH